MTIRQYENSYTKRKFEFEAVERDEKKCFVVRRYHKETVEGMMNTFGITETYVEDEEVILDDFFEAKNLYEEWLSKY